MPAGQHPVAAHCQGVGIVAQVQSGDGRAPNGRRADNPDPVVRPREVVPPGLRTWVEQPELDYNLLVYAGILVGIANLWAGARVLRTCRPARDSLPAIFVSLLLTVLELYRISRPVGPKGSGALLDAFGIGPFALAVMVLARADNVAAELGETSIQTCYLFWPIRAIASVVVWPTLKLGLPGVEVLTDRSNPADAPYPCIGSSSSTESESIAVFRHWLLSLMAISG